MEAVCFSYPSRPSTLVLVVSVVEDSSRQRHTCLVPDLWPRMAHAAGGSVPGLHCVSNRDSTHSTRSDGDCRASETPLRQCCHKALVRLVASRILSVCSTRGPSLFFGKYNAVLHQGPSCSGSAMRCCSYLSHVPHRSFVLCALRVMMSPDGSSHHQACLNVVWESWITGNESVRHFSHTPHPQMSVLVAVRQCPSSMQLNFVHLSQDSRLWCRVCAPWD